MSCFDWLLPAEGRLPGFLAQAESYLPVMDTAVLPDGALIVVGRVNQGSFSVGDRVTLRRADGAEIHTAILAMEAFRKPIETARTGDNISLLLSGVAGAQVAMGDVLMKGKSS